MRLTILTIVVLVCAYKIHATVAITINNHLINSLGLPQPTITHLEISHIPLIMELLLVEKNISCIRQQPLSHLSWQEVSIEPTFLYRTKKFKTITTTWEAALEPLSSIQQQFIAIDNNGRIRIWDAAFPIKPLTCRHISLNKRQNFLKSLRCLAFIFYS